MRRVARTVVIAAVLAGATLPATGSVAPSTNGAGQETERPVRMVALDAVRRPTEILDFLGLRAGMTAIDLPADGGYYSELMARTVGPRGRVIALVPDSVRSGFEGMARRSGNVELRAALLHALSPETVTPDEADFALLHIMYHDAYWDEPGVPTVDPQRLLAALHRALKPGAMVGVVDYVGEPGDTRAIVDRLHRIDPATVRADFERAGFVFEAESDLLRVASDDHSRSAIDPEMRGRTDLFVYRFRKPQGPAPIEAD